jgi:hypothetical protein
MLPSRDSLFLIDASINKKGSALFPSFLLENPAQSQDSACAHRQDGRLK